MINRLIKVHCEECSATLIPAIKDGKLWVCVGAFVYRVVLHPASPNTQHVPVWLCPDHMHLANEKSAVRYVIPESTHGS